MKMIFISLAAVATTLVACGQDIPASKVPSVVQNTVTGKFTHIKDIDWEKKKNFYEAEFDLEGVEYKAQVAPNGSLLVVMKDIIAANLPQPVTDAIRRDYAEYSIDEVQQVERNGAVYYQVELEKRKAKDIQLAYSADGAVAKDFTYIN
ncbi:MAG TPA: PepSY-like domain-containing protein [Chitinophagaceae bacterium]|nr:PepSY-like domain-containing protein [Chitinophagaceae bacterium]